ncbi:hypothetical protein HG530_001214 [Fusarium avenaceum]|nr:hypothetical protein HG530_001214 [Fusarium avenaceum]
MSLLESYSQICRDDTFGPTVPGLAECRGGFDFTVTFEESILSLAPACLIIAITPWRIYSLWSRPSKTRDCWLLNIKLFGFVALAVLQAVLLAFLSKSQASHRALLISSGTFQLLASISITALSYWEHRNTIRPSFVLAAFLFLTALLDATRARTQSFIPDSDAVAGILIAIVVAKSLLLLVETKDKASVLLPEYAKLSAELRSSLFSRAFFTWLFPVLFMGFKSVISSDDLPAVNEKLASQTLTAKVERRWLKSQYWLSFACSKIGGHQSAWFDKIEKRIELTSHTLSFLHPVKLLGLSRIMEEKLHKRREDELQTSQKFRVTNCAALAFASAPQALAPLVTFGAYSIARMLSGQPNFSEATAVTSYSILNLISASAMQLLLAIPMGAQAIGCYGRIQSFLQTPEDLVPSTATTNSSDVTSQSASEKKVIEPGSNTALGGIKQSFEKIEILSDPRGRPPVRFVPSGIIAITGPSGCGKSTLLRELLTFEQSQSSGIFPSGDIAYCSQTSWIFEGSIRDNILGQSEVNNSWYQSVLQSCELRVDLDSMPDSDATQVGSGGSKLSGGQKQRVAIARALYSKKKRVILDDITSALDGHTASSLINNLFSEGGTFRSQGMSVIVSTHSAQILRLADQVLLMDQDGHVIDSGPYAELVKRHEHYSQHQTADSSQPSSSSPSSPSSPSSEDAPVQVKELEVTRGEYEARLQTKVDDLRRKKGDWRSFTYYLGAMGWLGFSIFVACLSSYMVLNAIFGVWLVWWGEDTHGSRGLGYWLGLYATWAVLITIGFLLTPIFFFTKLASKASHVMHADLLTATMRFSQDIRLCDWQLPFNILLTLMALLACLASIGVAISAVPYLAIGAPAIAIVLYLLQMLYLRTSRQLRLLELEQKAPIVSLFLDSIQGIATIHSFGWSPAYVKKSYSLLDSCQRPLYTLYCIQRWLILVLSLIATGTELVVIGAAIALRTKVSAGLVGLAVVHVTTLAKSLCDLVMQWTDMETSLGAVSRIYRFSRETPREAKSDQGCSNLLEGWPLAGSITFENVSATYEDVPEDLDATARLDGTPKLALDSITFTINPGERVGICGRTGSGKSSLMAALLQILPCYQGRIFIDGTDLSTLHPEDVRSKLNYVTQEPFLFDGTMRENLRPWDSSVADKEMTAALEKVNLLKKVTSLGGLDAPLTRDSFSHGERQLFCLARSLLRSSSIVILDEPTGHIDPVTDATIQHVIRDGFSGRTVIMIAHRLRTLLEFDTAVVLDHGRVKESGSPKSLLNDSTSVFHALYYAAEGAAADTG